MESQDKKRQVLYAPVSLRLVLSKPRSAPNTQLLVTLLASVLLGIALDLSENVLGISRRVGVVEVVGIRMYLIFSPVWMVLTVLTLWLGFWWGVLASVPMQIALALFFGMSLPWTLTLLIVPLPGLALIALAYRAVPMSMGLRSFTALLFYFVVVFTSQVATSAGVFIWPLALDLGDLDVFAIWQGWWTSGTVNRFAFTAPLLYGFSPHVAAWKSRRQLGASWQRPPRSHVVFTLGFLLVVGAAFTAISGLLSNSHLGVALNPIEDESLLEAIYDPVQLLNLVRWVDFAMLVALAFFGYQIWRKWTASLEKAVAEKTHELRKSETFLKEAQTLAKMGSWEWSIPQRKLLWTEEVSRIFETTPEHFDGMNEAYLKLIHPEDRENLLIAFNATLEQGVPFEIEHRATMRDGSLKHIYAQGRLERDEAGNPLRIVGMSQDITQRKQAEEELRKTADQLRALAAHLQSVREEERTAVAREIHDELGQLLWAIKIDVSVMEKALHTNPAIDRATQKNRIEDLIKVIDKSIAEVRRLIKRLRPEALDLGLIPGLEFQAEEFKSRTGIDFEFNCRVGDIDLDEEAATAVYRIFQEALSNIARHARATCSSANISQQEGHLILRISDNGVGIPKEKLENTKTFGLLGMKERAIILGGEVDVNGIEGQGTTVEVRIPITREPML